MIGIDMIELFYTKFYEGRYKNKLKFKRTKASISVCDSFIKLIDNRYSIHSVGPQFLWDYFVFQFAYWEDCDLNNKFSDKLILAWIIGKKAFERWENRDVDYDWLIEKHSLIDQYNLNKGELIKLGQNKLIVEKPAPQTIRPYDSSYPNRKLFHNTDRGFAFCIQMTTLFDPKDISCIQCKFRSDCKELLKSNYPKLFSERKITDGEK